MKKSFATLFVTLVAGSLVVPGFAQPPVLVDGRAYPTAQVAYGDLNLASPAGVAALDGRIRRAAEGLCHTAGVRPLGERLDSRQCVGDAIASAQPQVQQVLAEFATRRFAAAGAITVRLGN